MWWRETPQYVGPRPAQLLDAAGNWWQRYGTHHDDKRRLAVVCVYWGNKYDVSYVRRLREACARHVSVPHDFYCITDDAVVKAHAIAWNVEVLAPATAEAGWWQKIGLFKKGLIPRQECGCDDLCTDPVTRYALYLDLDVVVTGSLDPLLHAVVPDAGLVMAENFGPNKPQAAHNSSVMLWRVDTCTEIFDDYVAAVREHLHGDQCWIWRRLGPRIHEFPVERVRSYKYDCRGRDNFPTGARVIVFHGSPDPHEVNDEWVRRHWKTL